MGGSIGDCDDPSAGPAINKGCARARTYYGQVDGNVEVFIVEAAASLIVSPDAARETA